jgi:hypothetical protein
VLSLLLLVSLIDAQSSDVDNGVGKTTGFNTELSAKLLEYKRKIPRYTIDHENGYSLVPGPSRMEPTIEYGLFLAVLAMPGLILCLITLFSCVFFCLFRYFCNCCGGRSYKGTGYKNKQIRRVRISMFVFAILGLYVAFVLQFTTGASRRVE